jgi:type II secretory pathway pseudopilin PulG
MPVMAVCRLGFDIGGSKMRMSKRDSRGFTLIAALLLTLLLSGLAVGLLFLVTGEQRMGNNDLENNLAYYGAEAGIENLTAQLSQLYQTSQSPNAAAITALTAATNYPTTVTGSNITNMNYLETIAWPPNQSNGTPCPNSPNPCGSWDIVGSGSDQGMVASLIPFTLQVTAIRAASAGEVTSNSSINPTGAAVNLTRTVEVALLPAFEFGVFCDGDCDYFAGPNFNFGGRVHANGNLFLASGSSLTFTDKIAAVGQVVTDQLENGWPTGTNYTGSVYVPSAGAACPPAPGSGPAANCNALPNGSWAGGFPPPPPPASCTSNCGGAAVPGWKGTSTVNFASFITTGLTGATKLQLPFVQADAVGAIEIIRRKQATDTPLLASSRLYSEASIRILMADTLADLHPDRGAGALDANDVQLVLPTSGGYQTLTAGIPGAGQYMYYATAKTGANGWLLPAIAGCSSPWPLLGDVTTNLPGPCGGPFLRVEYQTTAGAWVGVTQEWLSYGFGRPYNTPPTAPYNPGGANPACSVYPALPAGQCYNPVGPAILILQQLQQGVGVGSAYEATANDPSLTSTAYNWIPINFYDSREGEPRDNGARLTNTTNVNGTQVFTACSPNGVMNAVELDVGNLWLWLQKTGVYNSGHGPAVVNSNFNGYIVYFADHRGMIADPHPTAIGLYNGMTGMSGLEDTINSPSSTGVPDNALEPASYYAFSPEDVNADGFFDNWGEKYLAAGFGLSGALMSQPYFPIPANPPASNANQVNCNNYIKNAAGAVLFGPYTGAGSPQNNMVTGPRHVLRLVDGGMSAAAVSYLPHPPAGQTGDGFTVASEEPVYVWGDYNSGPTDPYWPSGNVTTTPHSAASIIADSVTLLSNPPSGATLPTSNTGWTDVESFEYPGQSAARPGNTSHYRMAIAAGKSVPFPEPGWAKAIPLQDFGTDGGMHNFLRYLEARGANGAQVNYTGSLISMFYSQYNTGIFKCCNVVYGAPQRNYFFDTQFLNPNNLPPGTPMFQDVVSLSYHQNFTPQ